MPFTTWAAYLDTLKTALAAGDFRYRSYQTPMGVSITFNTLKELQEHIAWVELKVSGEAGSLGGIITAASFEDA